MSKRTISAAATGLPKFDRAKLERAIERLILLLDLSDPDPDLEDDDYLEDDIMDEAVDDRPCDDNDQDCEPEEYFA